MALRCHHASKTNEPSGPVQRNALAFSAGSEYASDTCRPRPEQDDRLVL